MKKNEFAVVLASDNRGILPLSVTVFSLLSTAAPETFYKIYILSDGIDGENRNSVERLAAPFECRLEFIDVSGILEEHDFPHTEQWPVPAWGRVFIPELLKEERGNILYLDIDVLVCRDLTELFRTDMSGNAVGVVFENFSRPGSHFNERLEMPLTCTGYFNSGVLLMNVDVSGKEPGQGRAGLCRQPPGQADLSGPGRAERRPVRADRAAASALELA